MRKYIRALQTRYVILASAVLIAAGTVAFDRNGPANDVQITPVRLTVDHTPLERNGQMVTSFADVVKNVSPSVVKVYTTTKAREGGDQEMHPFFNDPMFRRFFGERFNEGMRRGPAPGRNGLGSGVIVTKDGYILTNNHVVDAADEVKVQVGEDGDEYTAKVVGKDPKTDIAVLKIDAKGKSLPVATVADSNQVEVGDVVLAVGNPFGIGQTVTMGIVSATGRATLGMEYEDFIQTDAAINPGNSGGALVDAHGRLVGINTAILSRSGGNQGIGFAIPVGLAKSVMESLIEHGRVVRGFMGVNIQDVTPGLAEKLDVNAREGALVADVTPKSPAEKAGLESGDVIVEFNGIPVKDSRNLKLQVAQTTPGKKVPLKVARNGKTKELTVTLKEFPQDKAFAGATPDATTGGDVLDGITVDDLNSSLRAQYRVPAHIKGVIVSDVAPGSPAAEAGLRPGDVIQELDRKPIKNAEEAVAMSKNIRDQSVLLRVWSEGGSRFVVVKPSEAHAG